MTTALNLSSALASNDISQTQKAAASQRQTNPTPTQQDVQQIRQIGSEASSAKAKVDKERAPETPKKTDAGFESQEDKEDSQYQKDYAKKSSSPKSGKRLEVSA